MIMNVPVWKLTSMWAQQLDAMQVLRVSSEASSESGKCRRLERNGFKKKHCLKITPSVAINAEKTNMFSNGAVGGIATEFVWNNCRTWTGTRVVAVAGGVRCLPFQVVFAMWGCLSKARSCWRCWSCLLLHVTLDGLYGGFVSLCSDPEQRKKALWMLHGFPFLWEKTWTSLTISDLVGWQHLLGS